MKNLVFYFWHLHKHKLTAHTDTDTDTDTDKQNYIIFLKTITEMQTNVIWDEKNPVCYTFCLLDNQNQSFKWMSVHFDWPIWIDAGSWLHWQPIHSAINDVNTQCTSIHNVHKRDIHMAQNMCHRRESKV